MSTPLVSVVTPCRDHGRFLDEAVDSVLAQSVTDVEILVVDDGSAEPFTRDLLDRYDRPRTRVLRTPPQGPSAARNTGIAQARGTFILPLDADDRLRPTFLERTLVRLQHEARTGMVDTEVERFGEATGPWPRPPFRMPDFLLGNTVAPAALFRRADFERTSGYNGNMSRGWEDFDFWLSLVDLGLSAARVPEVLFEYRVRGGSRSDRMTPGDWRRSYAQLVLNHLRLYAAHPLILPRLAWRFAAGRAA
jgi:glycosyltransferase involved in cell wall biosynthesis